MDLFTCSTNKQKYSNSSIRKGDKQVNRPQRYCKNNVNNNNKQLVYIYRDSTRRQRLSPSIAFIRLPAPAISKATLIKQR